MGFKLVLNVVDEEEGEMRMIHLILWVGSYHVMRQQYHLFFFKAIIFFSLF